MDEQIEEIQETKTIVRETVYTFFINHFKQLIPGESSMDLSWDWQLQNQMVPAFVFFPQGPIITKMNIAAPGYTHGNPLNRLKLDFYSKDG